MFCSVNLIKLRSVKPIQVAVAVAVAYNVAVAVG